MNKFATLCLLGVVSACPGDEHHKHHHHDEHHHEKHHDPLFGLLRQGKHCPKTDALKLNHTQADRLFLKNIYQGFIKGIYQANINPVADECFGEWTEPTWTHIQGLKHKAHDDFWSISLHEVKDVADNLIDDIYKNNELCKFERIGDDMKGWCLENPGQCIFWEGLEDRLFDNMLEILGEGMRLFKLFIKDDTCYTDMERMGEVYSFSTLFGEFVASLSGFDYKWDQTIERKHIKKSEFIKDIRLAMKDYKDKCPFELMFPDFAEVIKGIAELFKPVAHKQQSHHTSEWGQMKMPHFEQPKFELPQFQQPKFEMHNVFKQPKLPQFEMPTFQQPTIVYPTFEKPHMSFNHYQLF